jgi:hypothetical protein
MKSHYVISLLPALLSLASPSQAESITVACRSVFSTYAIMHEAHYRNTAAMFDAINYFLIRGKCSIAHQTPPSATEPDTAIVIDSNDPLIVGIIHIETLGEEITVEMYEVPRTTP